MKLLLLTILFTHLTWATTDLEFKREWKKMASVRMFNFQQGIIKIKGKEIKAIDKSLYNPWRKMAASYTGYDFLNLLDIVYGKEWRKYKFIVFTALDGYKLRSRIKYFLKEAQGKTGILSFKETERSSGFSDFSLKEPGDPKPRYIDPGPAYLVWTGFNKNSKINDYDPLKWTYQLWKVQVTNEGPKYD